MAEQGRTPRILIVDDRVANLVAMRALFDGSDYMIIEASSGREALAALLDQPVDLVLLDVNMPDMDGFETARLIRQRTPAALLPILFVSAREPNAADLAQGYSLGAVDYITKPVVSEVLRGKVAALLDVQQRAKALETAMQERTQELEVLNERASNLREAIGELEAFSYSVSHDMRAPLRAIHGFAQALEMDYSGHLPPEGRDFVKRIKTAASQLDRMITDVLSYSRINVTPFTPQSVSTEKVIRDTIEHNPKLQPPDAEITLERPLLDVHGDKASLTQCFSNLLSNAVKFVPPGRKPRVKLWTEPVGRQVRLWIEDNGIGIAREHQAQIFQAFTRLNSSYDGTGFGLAIVRKAVQRMGGELGVQSQPGAGSKFWIQLPASLNGATSA